MGIDMVPSMSCSNDSDDYFMMMVTIIISVPWQVCQCGEQLLVSQAI